MNKNISYFLHDYNDYQKLKFSKNTFYSNTANMKYFRINLKNYMQDLDSDSDKALLKEIKDILNKLRCIQHHRLRDSLPLKYKFSNLIYMLNTMPTKIFNRLSFFQ